jgi:soluble lytic murein transglycosylase-like protein
VPLVKAIIRQESNFNPWAIRVERGFWSRYFTGIMQLINGTPSKADDRWAEYPDITSCSYGLCQLMLTTAIELGFTFTYPTELLDPITNIYYGCKLFRKLLDKYNNNEQDAIAAYNQGNNVKDSTGQYKRAQKYVDSVLLFKHQYEE